MKSITLTVEVSGRLKDEDHESFDSDKSEVRVECVKTLDAPALRFLHDSFFTTASKALSKYYQKQEDYNREG